MNCGAKVFLADFDDSNAPAWDNLTTGQPNLRNALLRESDFSTPKGARTRRAQGRRGPSHGRAAYGHVRPGYSMLAATMPARMGERMPGRTHRGTCPDASIHRVPAEACSPARRTTLHADLAQHADSNPDR